jgi:hypothetical protein
MTGDVPIDHAFDCRFGLYLSGTLLFLFYLNCSLVDKPESNFRLAGYVRSVNVCARPNAPTSCGTLDADHHVIRSRVRRPKDRLLLAALSLA